MPCVTLPINMTELQGSMFTIGSQSPLKIFISRGFILSLLLLLLSKGQVCSRLPSSGKLEDVYGIQKNLSDWTWDKASARMVITELAGNCKLVCAKLDVT